MFSSYYLDFLTLPLVISSVTCAKCRSKFSTFQRLSKCLAYLPATRKIPENDKIQYNLNSIEKAEEIAEIILKNRKFDNNLIVEKNSGEGLLTKALMKKEKGIKQYLCIEEINWKLHKKQMEKEVTDVSQSREKENKEAEIQRLLQDLPKAGKKLLQIHYISSFPLNKEEEKVIKSAMKKAETNSMTYIRILPRLCQYSVIQGIIKNLSECDSIDGKMNAEYFFICTPELYRKVANMRLEMKRGLYLSSLPVMMDYYFDINCLAKIPNSCFTPEIKRKRKFLTLQVKHELITEEFHFLLHLVPRPDVVHDVDEEKLNMFLLQVLRIPKERIIPKMENVFADSGIHLIRMGVTMMDRFIDVTSQQLVQIYKEMQTWPGYEGSYLFSLLHEDRIQEPVLKYLPTQKGDNLAFIEGGDSIKFIEGGNKETMFDEKDVEILHDDDKDDQDHDNKYDHDSDIDDDVDNEDSDDIMDHHDHGRNQGRM